MAAVGGDPQQVKQWVWRRVVELEEKHLLAWSALAGAKKKRRQDEQEEGGRRKG